MEDLIKLLNQPLSNAITLLIGVGVLWYRVGDIKKSVDQLKSKCEERLKWCIGNFENKD